MTNAKRTRQDIRDELKARRWTHGRLAERLDCSRETITKTLAGVRTYGPTRAAIARELGFDPGTVEWDQ